MSSSNIEFNVIRPELEGETTCAKLPVGVPQGQSGPRLMAVTALLMAYYRQSKRRTAEFLSTLLGQPRCPALTVKMQNQVTAALRPSYEALAAALPKQEQLNIDETGTKQENGKAWLWAFVARMFTVFAVRPTREATALAVFLGEKFRVHRDFFPHCLDRPSLFPGREEGPGRPDTWPSGHMDYIMLSALSSSHHPAASCSRGKAALRRMP